MIAIDEYLIIGYIVEYLVSKKLQRITFIALSHLNIEDK